MIHRIIAVLILIAVATCAWRTRKEFCVRSAGSLLARSIQCADEPSAFLIKISTAWLGLIIIQIFLGAATIWTGKSADIATAHVAVGALSLVTGGLLSIISFRILSPTTEKNLAPGASSSFSSKSAGRQDACATS